MSDDLVLHLVSCRCRHFLMVLDPKASLPLTEELAQMCREMSKKSGFKFIRDPKHHCPSCHLRADMRRAVQKFTIQPDGSWKKEMLING